MAAGGVRQFLVQLTSRFGWFFLLAGLVMPGMQLYDQLTASPATATVIDIKPLCQKAICSLGKCRWRKIRCSTMDALRATGIKVRAKPYAKLAFTGADGASRTAWASFSKLEIETAQIGDTMHIVYRGKKKSYIAPPFQPKLAAIGGLISFAGLVLLGFARRLKGRVEASQKATRGPVSVERTPQTTPPWDAKPGPAKPTVTTAASKQVYTAPKRAGAVQRNRGWFG